VNLQAATLRKAIQSISRPNLLGRIFGNVVVGRWDFVIGNIDVNHFTVSQLVFGELVNLSEGKEGNDWQQNRWVMKVP